MTQATATPAADTKAADPKMAAMLEKYAKQAAKRLAKVRDGLAKYPHALPDTLVFDEQAQKYKVQIKCVKTGKVGRWVFTSDLHQVNMCEEAQAEAHKANQAAKRAETAKVKAAIRAQAEAEKAAKAAPKA